MPGVGTREPVLLLYLRGEVSEEKDGGRIRPQKDRAHEKLEMIDSLLVSIAASVPRSLIRSDVYERFVVRVKLDDDKVSVVGEVVPGAKGEVF